jgi:CRP/FNR family transcriptional regulator, cyclic AMP receptor protein
MSLSTAQTLTTAELRAIGLFAALPNEVLDHLAATLELRAFSAGDVVFQEGDTSRDMFAVLGGEMEVLKHSRLGREARVALLGPGDWFGEMSIVDVQPRSASVRVLSPSRLVRMTAADFDALYRRDIRAYALIILNLARELSRRLRVADGILADLVANVVDGYLTPR